MYENLPTAASFLISERCNLNCDYCFEKDAHTNKDMSVEVIHKSLDYLSDNAKLRSKNTDQFHAMIFGGEPLLRPDLIKELCNYGLKLQKEKDLKFTATVITNATQMNEEIILLLNEFKNKMNLSCQLSIDGDKESQNMYRKTKNGKGSFEIIEKNIEKFKKIYQDKPNLLSIHGCINKYTLPNMFKNFKFFRNNWGINNLWFMPIHEENWDENDVKIYREQLNKISDYLYEKAKENENLQEIRMYTPINKCLYPYKEKSRLCGAGKNFISITAEGDFYPCHFFYFYSNNKQKMKIGDVYNGINENAEQRKLFLTYDKDKVSCPSSCEHVNCYRCMGSNWMKNGNPLEQIRGYYCEMSKIEKEITDKMKSLIPQLPFYDPNNKKQMQFEKSWVEKGVQYEKYINQIGKEIIFERELNENEKEYIENYYKENGMNIIAKGIKIILKKIDNIEKQNKEILKYLKE